MLTKRIGSHGLVGIGIVISIIGCLLSLLPAQTEIVYLFELGLAGLGWNFMFNGATLLLAKTYDPAMKIRAQGYTVQIF